MTWEQKTEMIKACNQENYSEAVKLMLDNLKTIDEQSVDMFLTGMELTENAIRPDLDSHEIILKSINEKFKDTNSLRAAFRWTYYETIIVKLLSER